jgi:hypothetical protein
MAIPMAAAHAAPATSNPAWTIATDGQILQGTYKNLDVPAGVTATIAWSHVTGNVTVEGTLAVHSSQIDGNVDVNGGIFGVGADPASSIGGNLSIEHSPGSWVWSDPPTDGFWNSGATIGGNFSYTYNTGRLYVGNATVKGNFEYANNAAPAPDLGGLTVNGHTHLSS